MNLLKLVALILGNKVKDAADWVRNNLDLTLRLLYLSIGLPLLLTFTGLLVAGLTEDAGLIAFGRGLIIVSGLVSSILLTLFWVRATVLVDIIVYATKGAGLVTDKIKPLDTAQAEKFIQWLRGITTWITVVWLYVMIVPVWRDLGTTAIVLTCIVFFSGVMSSRWFNSPLMKKVVTLAVVLVFLFGTAAAISPKFAAGVRNWASSFIGDVTVKQERQDRLSEVQRAAKQEEAVLDQSLLRSLTDRQQQIRRRALELCNGRFCSEQEAAEYGRLEQDIRRVTEGTYWQQQAVPVQPPPVAAGERPVDGSSSADLPPPLSPRRQVSPPVAVPGQSPVRRGPPPRPGSLDEVFQELDKYPELK